ncbi:Maltooligosyl trehalose synthase [Rhodobacteraceae bacterium THAF1]|uniref:malto-oligosyltrehalose synthase n=1 Tax=Palleronia sp. THAF1 TaxID=2587842 RepID=UPI000F3DEEE5|nr:malto-oligosyltrehalose synthase [Palleronia sp. THAF1]QFU09439.1 Maltooligosyl trehalose synthase [Palleronia sp. THAF1]VDC21907.1 Maltooligosyl trehalose synthase [Rhodobacteraceae bacterium THAF1]
MTNVATYRVQLRDGLDFAGLTQRLPQIAALGVSHLYLSPILTAAPGSTHGYDVTDPTTVDASLGGIEGFRTLSAAAQDHGLRVVLDIVPNHMAFGLDTPWLVDVLRHGQASPHAPVFDIDWTAGPLALPWLPKPLAEHAADEISRDGDWLTIDDLRLPLHPDTPAGDDLDTILPAQAWQLLPWQLERDSITHRRFFSVTSLIGVRIEDPDVFEAAHACVFALANEGLIHGLRVDHVDGLVDPGGYLRQLTDRLGDMPVWVEKILVTGEDLPDWPVAGTTGYDAATMIEQALTDPNGMARIDALWREQTGIEGDFHNAVTEAKYEILTDELAAELRQLIGMAKALAEDDSHVVGPEMLREALTELMVAFPRYRSYIADPATDDTVLWRDTADRASDRMRDRATADWIVDRILSSDSAPAQRLRTRIEQVTGALLAKAHEDTAGFRFNRYIAANEVGADPDHPTADADAVNAHLSDRLAHWPAALTLGSSHDTKRSEDTRARLIAITHAPDDWASLWQDACALDAAQGLDLNRLFYATQVSLGLWGEPDAADRVADHMIKALREGKEVSYWTAPDEKREGRIQDFVRALLADWDSRRPDTLLNLCKLGEGLSLAETALRLCWPGMPDIYQGAEGTLLQLTDPDNRRTPDWDALKALPNGETHADRKADLIRTLLALRRDRPDLFAHGTATWDGTQLTRRAGDDGIAVGLGKPEGETLWTSGTDAPWPVSIVATPLGG